MLLLETTTKGVKYVKIMTIFYTFFQCFIVGFEEENICREENKGS